jgi:hypothetical protein
MLAAESKGEIQAGQQSRVRETAGKALAHAAANFPAALLLGGMEIFGARALRLYDLHQVVVLSCGAVTAIAVPLAVFLHRWRRGALVPRSGKELTQVSPPPRADDPAMQVVVDVWKEIVEVQMHFNDMLMRTRNYALTLLLAILAGSGVALEKNEVIDLGHWVGDISLASILLLLGVFGLLAFYALDRFYYHSLLVGAVYKATEIEDWLFSSMPAIDLGGIITQHSRWQLGPYKIRRHELGPFKVYARHKLTVFYLSLALMLTAMASLVKNVGVHKHSEATGNILCAAVRGADSAVVWVGKDCTIQTVLTPSDAKAVLSATKGLKPK